MKPVASTFYPKVAIIILNWNGWKDTIECLESLYQIVYSNYDVIVVDNGSSDDSIIKIKEYCNGEIPVNTNYVSFNSSNKPIKVFEYTKDAIEKGNIGIINEDVLPSNRKLRIIKNQSNYGFAEGNNIGINFALNKLKPDYIFLLNNDTVVIDNKLINELVTNIIQNNKIGIIGPKICFYDDPNKVWAIGGKVNLFFGFINNIGVMKHPSKWSGIKHVDYVTGCALMIKTKLIHKINLLDSDYFLYFEDADWNMRARKAGYRPAINCDVKILHKSGASIKEDINYYYFSRNSLIFFRKYCKWYHLFTVVPTYIIKYGSI